MAITPIEVHHGGAHMVDYTPTTDVVAGQCVLLGKNLCVTHRDIKANELGAVSFPNRNVTYRVPLKAGQKFSVGDDVKVDPATGEASSAGTAIFGQCVENDADTANGDTWVAVVFTNAAGPV